MYCRYCGAIIADDSVYCPKCGIRLIENAAISGNPERAEREIRERITESAQWDSLDNSSIEVPFASDKSTLLPVIDSFDVSEIYEKGVYQWFTIKWKTSDANRCELIVSPPGEKEELYDLASEGEHHFIADYKKDGLIKLTLIAYSASNSISSVRYVNYSRTIDSRLAPIVAVAGGIIILVLLLIEFL
jgi:hypothetical protein